MMPDRFRATWRGLLALAVLGVAAAGLPAPAVTAAPAPPSGSFEMGVSGWTGWQADSAPAVGKPARLVRRRVAAAPPGRTQPAPAPTRAPSSAEARPYHPRALFNRPIPAGTRDDPRSASIVAELVANTRARKVAATVSGETPPVYVVGAGDPLYTATIGGRSVRFRIPAAAATGSGADHPFIALDPSHPDFGPATELRLWRASIDTASRRITGSGGGLFHYNNDRAILNPNGSHSASVPFQGAGTGSGLSYLAGLVRPQEIADGRIRHALRFAYACNDSSSDFRTPATRTDQPHPGCDASRTSTPAERRMDMGMRLRLDPAVRCDARTAPILSGRTESARETRFVRIVCRALQEYGMIMMDGTRADGLLVYMENRLTARWGEVVGEEAYGSYGYLLRDRFTPGDGLRRDARSGIPWERMRVVERFSPGRDRSGTPPAPGRRGAKR